MEHKKSQIIKKIKKGVQIGLLGTVLTAGAMNTTGCTVEAVENFDHGTILPSKPTPIRTDEPYTRTIGNGDYFLHNFMGEDTENIQPYTVHQDVANYLTRGENFIQTLALNFADTLQDRPTLRQYFNPLIDRLANVPLSQKVPSIDATVNRVAAPCRRILVDMVKNLDNTADRTALKLCYATLTNEAYREGLGEARDLDTPQTEKYDRRKNAVLAQWFDLDTLKNINYCRDVETNDCQQITQQMNLLLNRAARNMSRQDQYQGITAHDLRNVINMALTTDALAAMHDTTATALRHRYCTMEIGIVNAIGTTTDSMQDQARLPDRSM